MSSTLGIPVLILGAWLVKIAITSPVPPAHVKKGDKISSTSQTGFESYVSFWAALGRYPSGCLLLLEALALALSQFEFGGRERWISNKVCPALPSTTGKPVFSTTSPLFILGMTSVYLGAFLRIWCFRVMGNFFTFEISIRPEHKLITSGPYGIVRHPSYLGVTLVHEGMALFASRPDSYFNACGVFTAYPITRWVFIAWILMLQWFVYALAFVRTGVEDKNLKTAFGKEWDEYRRRVPFKLLPKVY